MLLIEKYNVKPEWIELEITESGIMQNINDADTENKRTKRTRIYLLQLMTLVQGIHPFRT